MATVRKSAMSGCCSSSVRMNSMRRTPLSVNGQSAAAELLAHALGYFGTWRLDAFERVIEPELAPLVAAHLVEAQDLDALDGLEPGAEVRHPLHVVRAVGETGHQDVPDP